MLNLGRMIRKTFHHSAGLQTSLSDIEGAPTMDQPHRINGEATLQVLPYGVIIADNHGVILFMNRAAVRLLELDSAYRAGERLFDLPHSDVIRRCWDHPGITETIELTAMDQYLDLDQRRWLSFQAILLDTSDQPGPPQIILSVQ